MVWENVPGAFSSADGEDFRAVLEEIVRVHDSACHVPRPDAGTWQSAGAILLGDGFSLAWRVMDAQYWGVAQRRRRIFLVADFGGTTAPEILFKQDGLFGHPAESRSQREGAAATTQGCADDTGGACLTQTEKKVAVAFAANQRDEIRDLHDIAGALGAQPGTKQQTFIAEPLACLNDQGGERMDVSEEVSPTLRADMGGHPPLVAPKTNWIGAQKHGQQPLVGASSFQETLCIAGNAIDRQPQNGGNGLGCQADISYTITTSDHHAVFSRQRSDEFAQNDVVATQSARQHKDATDLICQPEIFGQSQYGNYAEGCATLRAQGGDNGGGSENLVKESEKNLIRRLTPLECEWLQGFPDGWTDIPGASDSARYKALSNSVAIPCVDFVLRGIVYFLRKIHAEQEESPACISTPSI